MHLFELAIELGERSADMAEAAEALGFEGITPTSELTPDQVQAFRARYAKAPAVGGGPAGGSAYQPPPSWGAPPGAAPAPVPSGPGGSLGIGQIVLIALAVIGVGALFAFMVRNSGPDEQQRQQLDASARQHESEIADHNAAAAKSGPDDPRDLATFCASLQSMYEFSQDQVARLDQDDLDGTRKIVVAGYEQWNQDLAALKAAAPPNMDDDIAVYEQNRRPYFDAWLSSEDIDVVAQNLQGFDPGPGAKPWHDLQTLLFERCGGG